MRTGRAQSALNLLLWSGAFAFQYHSLPSLGSSDYGIVRTATTMTKQGVLRITSSRRTPVHVHRDARKKRADTFSTPCRCHGAVSVASGRSSRYATINECRKAQGCAPRFAVTRSLTSITLRHSNLRSHPTDSFASDAMPRQTPLLTLLRTFYILLALRCTNVSDGSSKSSVLPLGVGTFMPVRDVHANFTRPFVRLVWLKRSYHRVI